MKDLHQYHVNTGLLKQYVEASGGMRPFCGETGLNRQTVYNVLNGMAPDYSTICKISEGLGLTRAMTSIMFFSEDGDGENGNFLAGCTTKELVDELMKREGVYAKVVEPYENETIKAEGSAIVLTVID